MKKYYLWRKAAILLCVMASLCCFMINTFAYSRIDPQKPTTLTLRFEGKKEPFSGAKFRLYRVADVSDNVTFTLTNEFDGSEAALQDLDSKGWRELAISLTTYTQDKDIAPVAEKSTGTDGKLTFADLTTGLYLVVGDIFSNGKETYTPMPFLVSMPNINANYEWDYDVEVVVKYGVTTIPDEPDLPQTGQLWWPVPVLAISGCTLLIVGIIIRKKDKKNEN